jgi:hypothetical protein
MRTKLELLLMSFLLLASMAWAGTWTIDEFDDSPDPGEEDNFIAKESGSGLKPVQPEEVSQQGNRLYVRQKFEDPFGDEDAVYQIFQGRAKEAAKGLGKISLDGIPYTTLLKMKLFYSRNAKGDDDLETVYFDGKDILVEGEDPVYINLNGKMEELKPVTSRDYKISITSEPAGATVTTGNTERGKTPVTFPVTSAKTITVVISKDGYYPVIKAITPAEKQTTQEGVLLTQKASLNNPAATFKSQLQAAISKKDASAIKGIKTDVQKTLSSYGSDAKKAIDGIMSKFPPNPAKTSSESSSEFSARQTIWNNAQARERDALNKEAQSISNELKELLAEVDAAVGEMEFTLKYEYIPNSAITFVNMGVKDFTVNTEISNSRVKFNAKNTRVSYGNVSRNEISQNEEYIHGVLKIWDAPNENGKYSSIYDVAFFYDETPLSVISKGSFTLPEATSASRSTEKDLNSRIARFPGKAAWDKRDSDATISALRLGEIPDASASRKPAAAPAPLMEDAYYDEDEDEEEFESAMGEQESYDYSSYAAARSATDIFGNTDEYLFWTGMAFAAAAIGTGVVGFLQHFKWQEANDAVKAIDKEISNTKDMIGKICYDNYEGGEAENCKRRYIKIAEEHRDSNPLPDGWNSDFEPRGTIYELNQLNKINKDTRDSYNMGRIIFWGSAGISLAISITLFAW